MKPQRGDIAICSLGHVGIIECDEPQEVTYSDGNKGRTWVGTHLEPLAGKPWSSRNPVVIARRTAEGRFVPLVDSDLFGDNEVLD